MIDTQSDFRTEAATIRFGGRELPRGVRIKNGRGRSTALAAGSHTRDIAVDDRQREFEKKLLQTIRREAGIEDFRQSTISDRDELVISYRDTLTALKRLSTDWNDFVQKLVRIDLRPEASRSKELVQAFREESEKVRKELLADAFLQPFFFSSALTGELISQDLDVAFSDLIADVERKSQQFRAAILNQLIRLIELEVCGLLVRYPNQVYAYHYFFRELSATNGRSYIKEERGAPVDPRNGLTQPFVRISRVKEADVSLTLCRRVHHIINGIEISPDRPSIPTPRFQQSVLDAIPSWLRPMAILVEGTLVGEAAIDQDLSQCKVTTERLLYAWYHRDPALVLGQIVLTGWGPRELAAEDGEGNPHAAVSNGTIGSCLSASWKTLCLLPAKAIAAAVSLSDQNQKREL